MGRFSGSDARFNAIQEISGRRPRTFERLTDSKGNPLKVSDYFGINTFNQQEMKKRLSKDAYGRLLTVCQSGKGLSKDLANEVATALRDWATERGATHFCHWFQPQTGFTAEKHDAFLSYNDDGEAIEKLSGSQLIQSEPDASSFPSGGMRTTFEARGYTAWDASSPMFIIENGPIKTLCIPSVFISYHGDALDEKTGLLRSADALAKSAADLLETIGESRADRIIPTLGPEQEYFLIDRSFYVLRPDLVMTGRTLLGSQPPRGQQLEDHYFGSIPSRVLTFMAEFEQEMYKLGVPIKTRHNEVAPSQFEVAPIFEEANIATDHNQLAMDVIKRVARRHRFEAILHEKPFAFLNGSGKHCNWSVEIHSKSGASRSNALDPGKTPHQNLRFLLFLMGTLKGVHRYAGLLRAGIASVGNDHRLGANEAPPAIISAFLGHHLSEVLDRIENGTSNEQNTEAQMLKLGVSQLPEVAKDNTDRNRTSPFAFTGNKFEFRAVGSSASPALPVTFLNTAVAAGLDELNAEIKAALGSKKPSQSHLESVIFSVLKKAVLETKSVRFEGNNYAESWVKEAEKRGLLNLRKTPESLDQLLVPENMKLLMDYQVFSEAEIRSRYHVRLERYIKAMWIEMETMKNLTDTQILPAAIRYHGDIVQSIAAAKTAGVMAPQNGIISKLSNLIQSLQDKRSALDNVITKLEKTEEERKQASMMSSEGAAAMQDLRTLCDQLEQIVADDYWPLPKYREMLFIS